MKKLNLKTLFLLMCLIMSLDMTAEHMTAEQARSAAQQFLRLKVAKGSSIKPLATRQVMPYSPVSDQRAAVYAVNLGSNDGFVLVGGNSQSQEGAIFTPEIAPLPNCEQIPVASQVFLGS